MNTIVAQKPTRVMLGHLQVGDIFRYFEGEQKIFATVISPADKNGFIEFVELGKNNILWLGHDTYVEPIAPIVNDHAPTLEPVFISAFNGMVEIVHANAVDKGFWEGERNVGEILALIHSEVSEALEAVRHGNPPDDKIPEFNGLESELADVVIRIMDTTGGLGLRVAEAIVAKIEFNASRPEKHGKAF